MKRGFVAVILLTGLAGAGVFAWQSLHRRMNLPSTEVASVPWTPPNTKLDPDYVRAAKALLGNGLSDPRGRVFEKVILNQPGLADLYGWVSADHKRVTLLNGVETVVDGHVEPADLNTALNDLLAETSKRPFFGYYYFQLSPATPALLLLAGDTRLAERAFETMPHLHEGNAADQLLARLTEAYYPVATGDLVRRRDRDGLEAAARMVRAIKVRLRFVQSKSAPANALLSRQEDERRIQSSLEAAQSLYADLERRVKKPKPEPVDVASLQKLDRPTRIATLIDDLDTVSGSDDPVCRALVAEGDATIPALIDAFERDTRLTRSFHMASMSASLGNPGPPNVQPVKRIAEDLILEIWPSSVQCSYDMASLTAPKLRALWSSQRGLTEPERWLQVLRNDGLGTSRWLEAARFLTKPNGEAWFGGDVDIPYDRSKAPMTGEPLRAKYGEEIASLMAKRIAQVCKAGQGGAPYAMDAMQLGHCLVEWAPNRAVPSLKLATDAYLEKFRQERNGGSKLTGTMGEFSSPAGIAIADRLALGDESAIADYKLLTESFRSLVPRVSPTLFAPVWKAPDNLKVRQIAVACLNRFAAGLSSTDPAEEFRAIEDLTRSLPYSPLLSFQPYRRLLVREMESDRVLGTGKPLVQGGHRYVQFQLGNGMSKGSFGIPSSDSPIKVGATFPVTIGDYLAGGLSGGFPKNAPKFSLLWTRTRRESARKSLETWLGDNHRDWLQIARSTLSYSENE
ncbi:MAG TPA: hypothetical protein VG944_02070 [Fimbriimonas sp.]|nr:hypothetical protein [Fimbriimonas sp.]